MWPNGWVDEDALGTEVDLGPGHIVLDGVPALHETGTATPHLFGPCLLWPRSPISATAELLYKPSPKIVFARRSACTRNAKSSSLYTITWMFIELA